ncbi:MAG: MFS transporter [Bacteroidota bacterium]
MTLNKPTNPFSFIILISIFFFWGFVAASNDILIPVFKEKLNLLQWQSQWISVVFYFAYAIGSFVYYMISKFRGMDILNKIGYKNGMVVGLIISAVGTLLFYPAANSASFPLLITGLFIVGLGFSLQQTAANPLVINFGDKNKGSQRLSLAGGINNIGTFIGPVILSYVIFGSIQTDVKTVNIESIKVPYLILGASFILVALFIKFSSIPNFIEDEEQVKSATNIVSSKKSALSYPQLYLGMIAIFVYVGVEVSTVSNLPEYMKQHLGIERQGITPFVSLFWASLMIGRWSSAVDSFKVSEAMRILLKFILPYAAFGFFLWVNSLTNDNISSFYIYAIMVAVLIVADHLSKKNPERQLIIYSLLGIIALLTGMFSTGYLSVFAIVSVGLFCSTLWPCIYTLAIKGLGKHTNEGSAFLIMMIMGGGVISFLQGYLAENGLGIKLSYFTGIACFAYLIFYAIAAGKATKGQ